MPSGTISTQPLVTLTKWAKSKTQIGPGFGTISIRASGFIEKCIVIKALKIGIIQSEIIELYPSSITEVEIASNLPKTYLIPKKENIHLSKRTIGKIGNN